MKNWVTKAMGLGVGLAVSIAYGGCAGDSGNSAPARSAQAPSSLGLANFDLSCNGTSGLNLSDGAPSASSQQSKEVRFRPPANAEQCSQQFQFPQANVSNFAVDLDCGAGLVRVQNKGGDVRTEYLSIQNDGAVNGSLQYAQQVQNDGRGSGTCWVQYNVTFDGKANCAPAVAGTAQSLALNTQVQFTQPTLDELKGAGVAIPAAPTVAPSVTPGKICVVESPCSFVGSTGFSCAAR